MLLHKMELGVWCRGGNGRLGHGDETNHPLPRRVDALLGRRVCCVAAGDDHSIAVTNCGRLWSWGHNLQGQLGSGDKLILRTVARQLGLTKSSWLQKRAIQFGTRIANRNVFGNAKLRGDIRLSEIVHPPAKHKLGEQPVGTSSVRDELNKKRRVRKF